VVDEDGGDWLRLGRIVFVVLVGTSYLTGSGSWRKVFVVPPLQVGHFRRHSG
jgi:hypothetical protein